jgi:uncharacterized repeat protein (TIGR01451 family)
MGKLYAAAAMVLAAFAHAAPALAQPSDPIETRLEARKVVVAADGKESLASADAARPGDVIEYTATYRNVGKQAVRNLEATLPIPANTELVPASAVPAATRASADARSFDVVPLKRKVKRAGGPDAEEMVPLSEYRALRWSAGELAPGRTVSYRARVRVLDGDPANGPPPKGGPR